MEEGQRSKRGPRKCKSRAPTFKRRCQLTLGHGGHWHECVFQPRAGSPVHLVWPVKEDK
jgi:hypothetical protein